MLHVYRKCRLFLLEKNSILIDKVNILIYVKKMSEVQSKSGRHKAKVSSYRESFLNILEYVLNHHSPHEETEY